MCINESVPVQLVKYHCQIRCVRFDAASHQRHHPCWAKDSPKSLGSIFQHSSNTSRPSSTPTHMPTLSLAAGRRHASSMSGKTPGRFTPVPSSLIHRGRNVNMYAFRPIASTNDQQIRPTGQGSPGCPQSQCTTTRCPPARTRAVLPARGRNAFWREVVAVQGWLGGHRCQTIN